MTEPTSGDVDEPLGRRAGSSVLWMTVQKWFTRVGGLVTIIVLTRVLAPEDFGLAATASTLLPLVYVLSDAGFATYIVQATKVDQRLLSTAFWFSLSIGAVLAALIFIGAGALGDVLGLPEVVSLVRVMTISVVIIAVGSVPLALMRRRMAFRSLAGMEVVGALAAQVIAIAAALMGAGAWALILQLMVSQVVTTSWVWAAARWLPSAQFSRQELSTIGGFGIQVVGGGLAAVLREWLEIAIVVAGLGVREMGYLNIAQRLVLTARDMTASALLPVSMVAFSRVKANPERVRSSYMRASAITYVVVSPLLIFVAVSAPVLIPFLFGDDKTPSASMTPALTAIIFINLSFMIDQGLHLGLGRPGRWLLFCVVIYALSVAVTAYSVHYGVAVLLLAWVAVAVVELISRWFVVGSLIDVSGWQAAKPIVAVLPSSLIAAGVGMLLMWQLAELQPWLLLAVVGIGMVTSYLFSVRLLRPATFADALSVTPDRLAKPVRRLFRQPLPEPPPG